MNPGMTSVLLNSDVNDYVMGYPDLRRYWLGRKGELALLPYENARSLVRRGIARILQARNGQIPRSVIYFDTYLG